MNSIVIRIFCLVLGFNLFQVSLAQTPSILLLTSDSSFRQSSSMIQLFGNGLTGSNSLDNGFISKSIFGGHLDDAHLDKIYNNMKSQNRAGFLATGGLELLNFSDTIFNKPQWGLRAGFSTNYHGYLSFNRDLYKTIYRGNKSFAGQSVDIGPLVGGYQSWQKFGVGIFNKNHLSSLSISLVAGQQYQSLIVDNAKLYTSNTGDSLSLSYMGDYMRSDSLRKGFANGSGLGLALDFNYNIPLPEQKGLISISIQDIGFISWNKQSRTYKFDSLTKWTGLEANNLFKLDNDSLNLPNLQDSLQYSREAKGFSSVLPASIHLRYSRFFSKKHLYEAGISIWPNRAAVPYLYAGVSHFFGEHFMLSERINYGGYGNFSFGLEAQWMPRGTWLIRVGTNNAEALVSKRTYGVSGLFTFAKFFGRVADNDVKPID